MAEQIVDLMEAVMPGPRGETGPAGPQGLPGVNAVDNDEAVAGYVSSPGSATVSALAEWVRPFAPFATPQRFGAAGDGVADDTEAFQAALDSGMPVFVPDGVYRITSGLTARDFCMVRASAGATIGLYGYADALLTVTKTTAARSSLGAMVMGGVWDGRDLCPTVFMLDGMACSMQDCTVRNFTESGIRCLSKVVGGIDFKGTLNASRLRIECNMGHYQGSCGIDARGATDSIGSNIVVKDCMIGIRDNDGTWSGVHPWISDPDLWNNSCCFVTDYQTQASDVIMDTMKNLWRPASGTASFCVSNVRCLVNKTVIDDATLESDPIYLFNGVGPGTVISAQNISVQGQYRAYLGNVAEWPSSCLIGNVQAYNGAEIANPYPQYDASVYYAALPVRSIGRGDDFNDYVDTGVWYVSAAAGEIANPPFAGPVQGFLHVSASANGFVLQRMEVSTSIFIRIHTKASWTQWRQLT